MPFDCRSGFFDQQAFLVFGEFALTLRISATVTDKLGIGESRDCFGRMPVHFRIDEQRDRHLQVAKQFGEPENPDTIAVVSPSVVEHVRLRSAGRKFGAQAFAERKPFEVEADIDGEAFAAWPVVDSTGGNG